MINSNILIAIATFKESENIKDLIGEIRKISKSVKVLIINDASGDNIKEIIEKMNDQNIIFLERPKKLGLGTAHKLSMFYAIKFSYDYLVTMDADFSHDPSYIPKLLEHAGKKKFIIGSRFCTGAQSDYKGLRKIISICGNFCAKKILSIPLNEITTYFRVYSVYLLKKLPFNELNAEGYSLGVKLVWLMKKLNAELIEIPIHFKDRNYGKSKIPKFQIFISFFDLIIIKLKDLFDNQKFYEENNTYNFDISCDYCKNNFFSLKKKEYVCMICKKISNT